MPTYDSDASFDHIDEAMKCIRASYTQSDVGARSDAELLMRQAQVHATLAVAGQTKRLVDLIGSGLTGDVNVTRGRRRT